MATLIFLYPSTAPLILISVLAMFFPREACAQDDSAGVLPVSSPAFLFSPGNWTGDSGRGGPVFRQTWYPGAYFRVTWTTTSINPTAELLLDIPNFGDKLKSPPELTYNIDGVWTSGVKCEASIPIKGLAGPGSHTLTVYFSASESTERWGTPEVSGLNVVRVTGLKLNPDCISVPAAHAKRWVLIIGDSITEGCAADNGKNDNLACWSYFVGTGLQSLDYEYGVSACGFSGWLRPGDREGDVPAYYQLSNSPGGFDEARSRWNKIDARNSLLDSEKRLSGHGGTGEEPSAILINFGTNDALMKVDPVQLQASITQSLKALQTAAPAAEIFVIIPFGQYAAAELKAGVSACNAIKSTSRKIFIIDLGPSTATGLAADNFWSGLHPNLRGHATFAARVLATVVRDLPPPIRPEE